VINLDSSVNNVAASPFTGRAVIDIGSVSRVFMGDAPKSPWCTALREPILSMDFGVLGDPGNLETYEHEIFEES
jgi:hypothetical protein